MLPVIARADTLTLEERAEIKQAVWRDLLAAGLGDSLAVFEGLAEHLMEDRQETTQVISDDRDLVDTTLETGIEHDTLSSILPLFFASSELSLSESLAVASKTQRMPLSYRLSRKYAWGEIDVLDDRITDTAGLYASLLSQTFSTVSPR